VILFAVDRAFTLARLQLLAQKARLLQLASQLAQFLAHA
jgi:hypothetical protein